MNLDRNHSGWWYPPMYELQYGGKERLIEPGELFRLTQNFRNDDKMIELGMVKRFESGEKRIHCDNCGKYFTGTQGKRFYYLHQENGCGRTSANIIYYGEEAERRYRTGRGRIDIGDTPSY